MQILLINSEIISLTHRKEVRPSQIQHVRITLLIYQILEAIMHQQRGI